jgi:hypothetical protein
MPRSGSATMVPPARRGSCCAFATGWPDARKAWNVGASMAILFSLACLALLSSGVLGCAADVAPIGTDEKHCKYVTEGGFAGLGVACAFL